MVAAGFAPTEFAPTSTPQAINCLKFIFILLRKKPQHCAHNRTKSQKKCLFLVPESIEDDWRTQSGKFRMSSWEVNSVGAKPVSFDLFKQRNFVPAEKQVSNYTLPYQNSLLFRTATQFLWPLCSCLTVIP